MSAANDFSTLNAIYKDAYADKVQDLIPDGVKLLNMFKFIEQDKQPGNDYVHPVTLAFEHGFTYGGSGGKAFNLRSAISSSHEQARIKGHEMVLRSYVSIGAISRSKGKNSFIQATKLIVENMLKSFARRLEVQLFYGQASGGIGVVESVSGNDVVIEAHEWAAGIWSGAENMEIDFRSSAGVQRGEAQVSSTTFNTRTVTVNAMPAGVVAGDVVYYAGAYGKEFAGIHKIITNTGTLFDIDASQYSLFRGNTVEVGTNFSGGEAVLSFEKVEECVSAGMEKGLADEKLTVVCNPRSWTNLLTEQTAKRQYDSSYSDSELKQGSKAIRFYGQNGEIEIQSSIFCKEGYAYAIVPDSFKRVGSTEITLKDPAMGDQYIKLLENSHAYELRASCDQALLCTAPGLNTLMTYIKS